MNPTIKTVKIKLDKERNLLLDLNGMAEFEEVTGQNLMSGIDFKEMKMKDFRALVWACLIHEDEKLTTKQVGKMITSGNIAEASDLITQALNLAMPKPDGEQPPLPKSPASSTG
ncbi:MAG: GTA-gp10 family protein [Eubacteriales bacterium]